MKRIFIIDEHQSSKQNGVGTYIRQLLKCFEGSGHDVNLLSFNSDEKEFCQEEHASYREYHIPKCGNNGFLQVGPLSVSLLRLYISDSCDNVFFINHFPCDKFVAVLKRHYPKSRTIFVIHDQGWCAPLLGDVELFKRILSSKRPPKGQRAEWSRIRQITSSEKRAYRSVDDIIALSKTTYDLLLSTYSIPSSKVHLIPNGLQAPVQSYSDEQRLEIRRRLGISPEETVLLYTGRTSRSKGIIPLLQAFDRLWAGHPELRLVIAGQVFTFNDFVRQNPSSAAHVTYTGLLPKERLADWYQIADIGILPSFTEQSSYTGIEMLAYGKLIVTTDGHNLTDMFNEESALIASIGHDRLDNPSQFVMNLEDAMQTAITLGDEACHERCKNARMRFSVAYSFDQWKSKYTRLISG